MKQYCVQRVEIYRQDVLVDADSSEQAIEKVVDGEGIEGELHYQHTAEPDDWGMDKWLVFEVK